MGIFDVRDIMRYEMNAYFVYSLEAIRLIFWFSVFYGEISNCY